MQDIAGDPGGGCRAYKTQRPHENCAGARAPPVKRGATVARRERRGGLDCGKIFPFTRNRVHEQGNRPEELRALA